MRRRSPSAGGFSRRGFLGALAAAGLWPAAAGNAQTPRSRAMDAADSDPDLDIDPYFLDPGDIDDSELAEVAEYVGFQEQVSAGSVVTRRSRRPRRAPNYRFVRWHGPLGDRSGRFVGPLATAPILPPGRVYKMNAQLLEFRAASGDWKGRNPKGTLTIELRSRLGGEPMTWLFGQHFDVDQYGSSTLSQEYISQRGGSPDPVLCDAENLDVRIQLMRHRGKVSLFRKILGIFAAVSGFGVVGQAGALAQTLPAIRVPRMLREGVAFSQAFFGGMADEAPIWRSGFTTYALATGASRLALAPGFWVAIDERRETDLTNVVLEDKGGRLALTRDGRDVDANYLILGVEIGEARPDEYTYPLRAPSQPFIRKGIPEADG